MMLTQQRLQELLNYDPDTGEFRWKSGYDCVTSARGPRNRWAGQLAGVICVHGYRLISVDNERFRASRLAWFYMTGEWPPVDIDHVNGKRSDDRWQNLRVASESENMRNSKRYANNTSGTRGVSWNKRRGKWHARVRVDNKVHHCGYFVKLEDAKAARDRKAAMLHGAFARFDTLQIQETPR